MKPKLKLAFADFWSGFDPRDNFFQRLLSTSFDLVYSAQPDLLIYSVFGKDHLNYRCLRVLFSGENRGVDFTECDYAFTGDYSSDLRHYRLPFYAYCFPPERFIKPELDLDAIIEAKKGFCSFVVSNPRGRIRNRFFKRLSQYKQIASGGKYANNLGYRVPDKESFIRDYKFNLAFENMSHRGYTTEKLIEPLSMSSVPIYWGNPVVQLDFNHRAFLNYHQYKSEAEFIQRIIEVDTNDDLYRCYLAEDWCIGNELNKLYQPQSVLNRFQEILNATITPVALQPRSMIRYVQNLGYRLQKKSRNLL